jgi:hypothetical protein
VRIVAGARSLDKLVEVVGATIEDVQRLATRQLAR